MVLAPSCEFIQKTYATYKFVTKSLEFKVFASKTPWPSFSSVWCHFYTSPGIALNWSQLFLIEALEPSSGRLYLLPAPSLLRPEWLSWTKGLLYEHGQWALAGYSHRKFVVTWFGLGMVLYTHMRGACEACARAHAHTRSGRAFFLIIGV